MPSLIIMVECFSSCDVSWRPVLLRAHRAKNHRHSKSGYGGRIYLLWMTMCTRRHSNGPTPLHGMTQTIPSNIFRSSERKRFQQTRIVSTMTRSYSSMPSGEHFAGNTGSRYATSNCKNDCTSCCVWMGHSKGTYWRNEWIPCSSPMETGTSNSKAANYLKGNWKAWTQHFHDMETLRPSNPTRGNGWTYVFPDSKDLAKRGGSLAEFCLSIAQTYKFLVPLPTMVTLSPKRHWLEKRRLEDSTPQEDGLASVSANLNQRTATAYCENVKQYKLERFRSDPELNRIRLDETLNHKPVNVRGATIKCTFCSSGRGGKHSSAYKCPTCCVFLCLQCYTANSTKNCFCNGIRLKIQRI